MHTRTVPQPATPGKTTPGEAVRLYRPTEVAKILDVSYDWVNDRINGGKLPYVELGTSSAKRRIRADDLQAFIDARTFGQKGARA